MKSLPFRTYTHDPYAIYSPISQSSDAVIRYRTCDVKSAIVALNYFLSAEFAILDYGCMVKIDRTLRSNVSQSFTIMSTLMRGNDVPKFVIDTYVHFSQLIGFQPLLGTSMSENDFYRLFSTFKAYFLSDRTYMPLFNGIGTKLRNSAKSSPNSSAKSSPDTSVEYSADSEEIMTTPPPYKYRRTGTVKISPPVPLKTKTPTVRINGKLVKKSQPPSPAAPSDVEKVVDSSTDSSKNSRASPEPSLRPLRVGQLYNNGISTERVIIQAQT